MRYFRNIFVLIVLLGFFISGCVPVLIGTGIVTGYTLSNDSVIGNVKSQYSTLWDMCLKKLERMEANITETKESAGLIKADISGNNVSIKIDTISPKTQRLKVSARKYLIPQPRFAQKIFFKIVEDIK